MSVNSEDARTAASVAMGFDRMARFYDTPRFQRVLYRLPQDAVLSELRSRGSRRILDVGCGTGLFADRIHRKLSPDDVVGVDPSTGMLAQAKARSSAVRWTAGTAEALPLPDESVDAVTSTTAFHFFDQPAAMAEFYRVLAPGGVLALATIAYGLPTPIPVPSLVQKWRPLPHNPSAAELRDLFRHAGFELVEQRNVSSCVTHVMWFHRITVGVKPAG